MPPKAVLGAPSLSAREMELLQNYMRCVKTKPEIDMEKFAAMSGFGGVPSARANIGRLLAKLSAEGDASGFQSPTKGDDEEETAPETPVTGKKKGTGRKRKGDAVEGNTAEDTPVKKKKATPSKAKGKALANAAKSEDEPSPIKEEVVDEASEEGA